MQDPPQSHHRRAHSESTFRLPDNLSDPFTGSEDDLFTTYMDMEKLGSSSEESTRPRHRYSNSVDGIEAKKAMAPEQLAELWTVDRKKAKSTYMDMDKFGSSFGQCGGEEEGSTRPRHRYSNLVDGIEAKKAMAPEKLAEFWTVNPKKAKRIIANRQSAARSKERKARYITELERKVLTLQTEAATLSAQLTMFQRDTTGLSNENTELKFRLQAMEQQAQLRDALNEALKQEVERLKFATGEFPAQSDTYNFGMQNFQYSQTSFFKQQPHQGPNDTQSLHTPLPNHQHSNDIINHHNSLLMGSHSQAFSDILQQDSLGHFQGLDINARGTHLVKSEGPSISASESSTTF